MTSDGLEDGASRPAPADSFFIVGIGASAGGLAALSAFLGRVTVDGAAFVVVQHLAREQTSMLTELLGRASRLQVVTAENDMPVHPNCVYVTPPNVDITIREGALRLRPPSNGDLRPALPIDGFFRTLATDQGSRAIGVVLSGTGTDGTFGLAAIKSAGGITFAQDPTTAGFDGMPRSALEAGVADYSLSPEAIADEIRHLGEHPYLRAAQAISPPVDHMNTLSALIKRAFGLDLSFYKPNTVERRLQRRMALHRLSEVSDYVRLCQADPKELAALHHDVLINVTAFFRDGEPFESLQAQVLPKILARKQDGSGTVRVWVPGCSTGEEAYTIAICLLELLDSGANRNVQVQIFATDVDSDAIHQARRGIFPPNIAADVSPERLHRFFIKTDDGRYQVSQRVRDLVVFSNQNLTRDAPFSKLDLISCRNVLIYLQAATQRRVLRVFHYALLPDGFLMLGTSETVGDSSELFSLIDRNNKVYTAKHVALLTGTTLDLGVGPSAGPPAPETVQVGAVRPIIKIAHLADRKILDQYSPAGVVVNENLEILYFRGRTASFIEHPSGVATHSILRLVRAELHSPLKAAIERASASGEPTRSTTHYKDKPGGFRPVTLIVHPLQEPESRARCLLILFKEPEALAPAEAPPPTAPSPEVAEVPADRVRELAQELALTKDHLQSTVEDAERANEDLKAANEELQSSNEELQSTNEELETSKEELQSTNEELITLNDELRIRMHDLTTSNDDLHNLLTGIDRPVIIVGMDLRIRRFTQAAERILDLLPADLGRSVSHLNSFLGLQIEKRVSEVISQVKTSEEEVQAADQRWYCLRIAPYKTLDLSIRGVVVTLIDIELRKRRTDLAEVAEHYAEEFLSVVQHPLMMLDERLAVVWVNEEYLETFGVAREELLGGRFSTVSSGQWAQPELETAVNKTLESGAPFRNVKVALTTTQAGRRWSVAGRRIPKGAKPDALVLLSIEGDHEGSD